MTRKNIAQRPNVEPMCFYKRSRQHIGCLQLKALEIAHSMTTTLFVAMKGCGWLLYTNVGSRISDLRWSGKLSRSDMSHDMSNDSSSCSGCLCEAWWNCWSAFLLNSGDSEERFGCLSFFRSWGKFDVKVDERSKG